MTSARTLGCLSFLVALLASSPAMAGALDDFLYETSAPLIYFQPSHHSLYYPNANAACVAQMPPPYTAGNTLITYSNPRADYQAGSLGCSYRVVRSVSGNVTEVTDPWFGQNWITKYRACPVGYVYHSASQLCRRTKPVEDCNECTGNPIHPARAFKSQHEIDYRSASTVAPLFFKRQYASWHFKPLPNTMGRNWFIDTFGRSLTIDSTFIVATRALDAIKGFDLNAGTWTARSPTADRLEAFVDGQGSAWRYYDAATHAEEFYDAAGRLLRIAQASGGAYTLQYSDGSTPTTIAPYPGLLISVQSSTGAAMQLSYDADGRLILLQDPAGGQHVY